MTLAPSALAAIAVAAAIATFGLWWMRLMLPVVKTLPNATKTGLYLLVWLAYFILTLIIVAGQPQ
ncbi:MAG: hypothetical protein AAGC77_06125 [Pseudomonadota bacterium]